MNLTQWLATGSALWLVTSSGCLLTLTGCLTAFKGTDHTKLADYATRGEMYPGVVEAPASALDPSLTGTFKISTTPGANVTLTAYYPDGQKKLEFTRNRSQVLDGLIAGLGEVDRDYLGQDRWAAEFAERQFDKALPLIVTALQSKGGSSPSSSTGSTLPTPAEIQQLLETLRQYGVSVNMTPPGTATGG